MYVKHPTLISTQNNAELSSLWKMWKQAIVDHPFFYLRHRAGVWLKLINKNITDYYYYLENETSSLKFKSITVPFLKSYLAFFPSLLLRFYWVFFIFFLAIKISIRKTVNLDLSRIIHDSFYTIGCLFFLKHGLRFKVYFSK
jgi:hypothetical protein